MLIAIKQSLYLDLSIKVSHFVKNIKDFLYFLVNGCIRLPFIRTSPDHGTAFDIASKGIADATSMKAAI